jgi:hypothetical protein
MAAQNENSIWVSSSTQSREKYSAEPVDFSMETYRPDPIGCSLNRVKQLPTDNGQPMVSF